MNPRREALKILERVERDDAYLNRMLDLLFASRRKADPRDLALTAELAYGVERNKRLLDFYIQQVSTRKIDDIDPKIRHILRIGVYQILFLDRIPPHAAVSETVSLARAKGEGAVRFVNAVLRELLRQKESLKKPDVIKNPVVRLGIKYSFPDWIVETFFNDFKERYPKLPEQELWQKVEQRLQKYNSKANIVLRVNTLRTTRDEFLELLRKRGIEAEKGRFAPEAVIVKSVESIRRLPGYKDGLFMVQDEGSMLVSHLLAPAPGERILDVGAAPGGKTTHMAQLMQNQGEIVAVDINAAKVSLIQENAVRLGIMCVGAAVGNALEPSQHFEPASFDRVMLDAPCTGLGVLRRHPEAKWKKKPEDVEQLASLQARLLDNAARYVKRGGVLVYSVCTLTPEEGRHQIERFLKTHPAFTVEPHPPTEGVNWGNISPEGYLDLADVPDVDGFFAARLRRR